MANATFAAENGAIDAFKTARMTLQSPRLALQTPRTGPQKARMALKKTTYYGNLDQYRDKKPDLQTGSRTCVPLEFDFTKAVVTQIVPALKIQYNG